MDPAEVVYMEAHGTGTVAGKLFERRHTSAESTSLMRFVSRSTLEVSGSRGCVGKRKSGSC